MELRTLRYFLAVAQAKTISGWPSLAWGAWAPLPPRPCT